MSFPTNNLCGYLSNYSYRYYRDRLKSAPCCCLAKQVHFFARLCSYENGPKLVFLKEYFFVADSAKSDDGVYQCFVKNGVGQNEMTVVVIVNGGSEDKEEEEGGDVLTDFYPESAAAGPDFQDLKAAPPSRPNVTQVGWCLIGDHQGISPQI